MGSIHWFDGVFIFLIALALVILGLGEVFEFRVATHHSQEILLVGLVPIFLLLDGLTRLHMVLRQSMRLSFRRTLRVLGMWFSVKFSNAQAAVKALIGFRMPFVRTPKAPDREIARPEAFARALRVAPLETVIALLLFTLAAALGLRMWALGRSEGGFELARGFLAAWLVYYGLIFFCAPLYAYRSYVTFRPEKKTEPGPPAYEAGRERRREPRTPVGAPS